MTRRIAGSAASEARWGAIAGSAASEARWGAIALLAVLAACAGSREEPPPPYVPPDREVRNDIVRTATGTTGDAPEISRSVGAEGGVVLFWPRIVPRAAAEGSRDVALAVQEHLRGLVERTLPGRAIDVRPEPERVCPRAGCTAMTVGALLLRNEGGCIVLGIVSGPGTAPARLVPWIGQVDLRQRMVPFREPPEAQVTARDFGRCSSLAEQLGGADGDIAAAIQQTAP
ncbi:MAG: hypothetical protein HYY06_25050 [Deltaproteobacteria bacterium]|nr:hypothetical protein [Deltaproteobacteria bacterium]